ncbi:Gfo/Idh/MocA family protein [Paracoccaceae bacterium GXU_MW_L88]
MPTLGWGLIGASNIASQYMIDAIRGAGGEVRSVLSSDSERGAEYAKNHGIPGSTTDLDAMLADDSIDVVYISTTNEKHFAQAMAAIAAGKHVVCEKPLAMTAKDAAEMVRKAEAAGVTFATNHHLRNAGSHQAIRDLIASGKIGEVLSFKIHHAVHLPENLRGWRINNPEAGGGVIADIVVHDADTVRFHLGEDPVEVVAMKTSGGMGEGVEDSNMSIWSMPSGVMVSTHESFTHPFAKTGIEVNGTKGVIRATNVMTQEPAGTVILTTETGDEEIDFLDHDLYGFAMQKFTDAVNGTGRPAADGVDGVKSLAVAEAVMEAATSGQRTRVDYQGFS